MVTKESYYKRRKREALEQKLQQVEQKEKLSKYTKRSITRLDIYYNGSDVPQSYVPYNEEALKNITGAI